MSFFSWQEGFFSNVKSLRGVKHAVLLSQVRIHLHDRSGFEVGIVIFDMFGVCEVMV